MTAATDQEKTLLDVVRTLLPENQRTVLSYALFLLYQKAAQHLEADEAERHKLFSQPEKMAQLAELVRQALAKVR